MAKRAWAGAIEAVTPWLEMYLRQQETQEREARVETRTEESAIRRYLAGLGPLEVPEPAYRPSLVLPEEPTPPVSPVAPLLRGEVAPPAVAPPAPMPGFPERAVAPAAPTPRFRPVTTRERVEMLRTLKPPLGVRERAREMTPWQQGWKNRQDTLAEIRASAKKAGVSDRITTAFKEMTSERMLGKMADDEAERLVGIGGDDYEIAGWRKRATAHRRNAESNSNRYYTLKAGEKDPGVIRWMAEQESVLEKTWFGLGKPKVVKKWKVTPIPGAKKPTPKALTPEDQRALDWANANPTDPRAAQIKRRLGR